MILGSSALLAKLALEGFFAFCSARPSFQSEANTWMLSTFCLHAECGAKRRLRSWASGRS